MSEEKIISLGVWAFSNNAETYAIFQAMVPTEIGDAAGDIIVRDDTWWVSWLKLKVYLGRTVEYVTGNFGGIWDRAIDLD